MSSIHFPPLLAVILCLSLIATIANAALVWRETHEELDHSFPDHGPLPLHPHHHKPSVTTHLTDSQEQNLKDENELAKIFFEKLAEKFEEDSKATTITTSTPVSKPESEEEKGGLPIPVEDEEKGGLPIPVEDVEKARHEMEEIVRKAQQLQQKFAQIPPALTHLIFGNDSTSSEWQRPPVVSGERDKQIECVTACERQHWQILRKEVKCSELSAGVDCVAKCRPGLFADYIYNVAKRLKQQHCQQWEKWEDWEDAEGGEVAITFNLNDHITKKAMKCFNLVLSDVKPVAKVAKHALECYLEIQYATNDKEACYALKYCAVDSTAEKLREVCGDDELADAVKYAAVYSLTKMSSNGNLIRECPILYEIEH